MGNADGLSEILLDIDGRVAVITLNAPERRNAFVPHMVDELLAACEQIDNDESIGAVVIQPKGTSFCSGSHRPILAEAGRDPARADNFRNLGHTDQPSFCVLALRP